MTRLTCHHNKTMRSKTASAGFTMVELLAVVGILAIVGLIAVFSLGRLRLDLRQRELDSKAELLYTAAQKQMAELHAAGWEDWYQPGADGVVTMPFPPSDADEESQKTSFCYVLANTAAEKETTAAAAILPMSAVDAELWDGCWYIEYAPDSGSVYAVFYSASPLPDPNTLDDYRSYQYRRRMGAKVGYYGGDIAQTQQTGTLQPSLTIENAEKLTATFYCNRPTEQPITLTIQLSDGISTYTKKLAQSQLYQQGSRLYRYTWVLDDLTRDSTRFYAQTGGKLLCGVPITVTLTASSDDPLVDQVSVSAVTNGLFDDRTDYGTDSATALISCGRHLQNLDAASHAASTITAAVQISDISFTDDTTDDKDWYSCYGPSFTPITNQNLTRYSGLSQLEDSTAVQSSIYGLTVSSASTADVGLFSSFAGSNNGGSLRYCYSATALTAAGEAEVYGLTRIGGGALECCYLNGGTYSYGGHLYAYNTAANSFSSSAAGRPITGADLEKLRLSGFSRAAVTRYDGTDSYPYPAVVRNDANRVVHYGQWPTLEHIGTLGVFYWEYESGGSAGYHLSYVGTDDGTPISGSSLCTQHNDGGVVTRYGYGYFCATNTVTSADDISYQFTNCRTGTRRSEVEQALAAQMKGYSFVAFETGPVSRTAGDGSVSWTREDTMYLTGADVNSQWTLSYGGGSYTYSVCPFFADAITLTGVSIDGIGSLPISAALPGAEADSAYEIRSVSQLQNINWNYGTLSTDHYVSGSTDNNITKYPYLGSYRNSVSSGQDNFTNETRRYWVQSHDVDAVAEGLGGTDDHPFTPIGSMVDTAHVDNGANSQPYAAYFASNYDGDAYTIRNIQIRSTAQCIGLFGFTVGADLKDIIMYSDQGNEVINDAAGTHWYAMGGLVGFAGAGKNGASFTNCSVSGYIIRDLRANNPGWGGGCVGGLVGATNMNITGCSAVTDIIIHISYDIGYRNLRVGGIAGVCRATLDKCYAGGSIQAEEMRNNYNGTGRSTNIWVAGLVGGVILRDQGNLESSMGTTSNPLTVQNCYSYVKLPTTTNAKTHVVASFAIASNGEMLHSFSIRYNSNGIQYTIPNPHAIIRNCYCLTSAVVNTNDYTSFRNLSDADWKAGKNINMKDTSDVRRVVLTNDRSPYISYQDMADPDKLAAWLNNGVSASPLTFDFVTVEENGVRIDGKYSFPGADAGRLDGLNYPFPTILTQLDAFGRTVNVHYGPWPMHGLYWESTSADLDLFADRGDGRLPTLTVGLYPENNAVNTGQTPTITLLNEDGTPADDTLIGSTAVAAYDAASGCWQVTFTASAAGGEGVVVARASLGSYTADLTIRVGAVLSLTHDKPAGVTVRYGAPSETVTLSLRDSHGDPVTADAAKGETIGWSVAAETLADGTAVVECDAADIRAVAGQAGDFTLPVTGFAAGDSAITVTCTYTYLENGVPKRIQSSTIISACSLRDAVGLVYDVEEDTVLRTTVSGVYLPCEGTGSTEGGDVTAPDFERQTGSLYLFAGNAYTDLNDFTVDLSGLTAVDSGGNALDGTRWAIYAGDVIEADDYRYRLLTVETDQPRRLYISGTVTLRRNGVTYQLTLTNYPCGADPAP